MVVQNRSRTGATSLGNWQNCICPYNDPCAAATRSKWIEVLRRQVLRRGTDVHRRTFPAPSQLDHSVQAAQAPLRSPTRISGTLAGLGTSPGQTVGTGKGG